MPVDSSGKIIVPQKKTVTPKTPKVVAPKPPIVQQTSTTSVPQAPVPQSFTFTMGLLLIVVAGLVSGQFKSMWDAVWEGKIQTRLKKDAIVFAGEILFVFVLSFLGSANSDANAVILAFFISLWVLWGIKNADTLDTWKKKVSGG